MTPKKQNWTWSLTVWRKSSAVAPKSITYWQNCQISTQDILCCCRSYSNMLSMRKIYRSAKDTESCCYSFAANLNPGSRKNGVCLKSQADSHELTYSNRSWAKPNDMPNIIKLSLCLLLLFLTLAGPNFSSLASSSSEILCSPSSASGYL